MLYNVHQSTVIYSVITSIAFIVLNLNIICIRYTNADLEICQYLPLHMKITFPRFHIKTPFPRFDIKIHFEIDARDICEQFLRKHSEKIEYVKN